MSTTYTAFLACPRVEHEDGSIATEAEKALAVVAALRSFDGQVLSMQDAERYGEQGGRLYALVVEVNGETICRIAVVP